MSNLLIRVGDMVTIPEIGTGVVTFIDTPNIYEHHYQPIQIELEKPYDNHKHITYRTNLKTLEGMGEDVLVADPLPFDEETIKRENYRDLTYEQLKEIEEPTDYEDRRVYLKQRMIKANKISRERRKAEQKREAVKTLTEKVKQNKLF